ncbi:MAG: acyltransferase [Verrucomicrobiales bacterium]|nr:acyltransferase [Verrucomicrobiales bacterium]
MKNTRVASVQFEHLPGDKEANLNKVRRFAAEAAGQGAELVVCPEMCVTGYWFLRDLSHAELDALAEPIPDGPTTRELLSLSREHGISIGAGFLERSDQGELFNSYVVAMPDGSHVRHRKLHAFVNEHVSSGSEFTVFDLPSGNRAAILICYDNNLFENTRMVALQGAEILIAPHQTGGCRTPSPRCMGGIDSALWHDRESNPEAIESEFRGSKGREWLLRWLPSRAHDNGMFLIFSNGVGIDGDEVRTGNAMILNPYGEILVETWAAADKMIVADLEAEHMRMNIGMRWIQSRRPNLYEPLAKPTGREMDTRTVRFKGIEEGS